jgi:hypothetical protein
MISDKPCKVCGSFERYASRQNKCVSCHRKYNRQRYAADSERFKKQVSKHREANKEKIREYRKTPRVRELMRQNQRAWHEKNREHVRQQQRDWSAENIERAMLRRARASAKKHGWDFNLELSDIVIPETCPLLGIVLERKTGIQADSTPSLDRIDSSIGYVKENVWVISWRANNFKRDATLEELKKLVDGLEKIRRARFLKKLVRVG